MRLQQPFLLLLLLMMMMMMSTLGDAHENSVHWPWDRQTSGLGRKTRTLNIGGIFPMSGAWAGGRGCRPAVYIALEDINQRTDLLPQFRLQMLANDSRVFSFQLATVVILFAKHQLTRLFCDGRFHDLFLAVWLSYFLFILCFLSFLYFFNCTIVRLTLSN